MLEQVFNYSTADETKVERLLFDENIHYIHMLFNKEKGLPVHNANATLYMTVVRGTLSLKLGEQDINEYEGGTLVKIPDGTLMHVRNLHEQTLELIVVKAPIPVE